MTIYAVRTTSGRPDFYTVHTIRNQGAYSIRGVAPGSYKLYADPAGGPSTAGHRFGAAYTAAVGCGLAYGCNDHSVLTVEVSAGAAVTGIDVGDWYAPQNSFPVVPPGDPALLTAPSPSPHYPDAASAPPTKPCTARRRAGCFRTLISALPTRPASPLDPARTVRALPTSLPERDPTAMSLNVASTYFRTQPAGIR